MRGTDHLDLEVDAGIGVDLALQDAAGEPDKPDGAGMGGVIVGEAFGRQ